MVRTEYRSAPVVRWTAERYYAGSSFAPLFAVNSRKIKACNIHHCHHYHHLFFTLTNIERLNHPSHCLASASTKTYLSSRISGARPCLPVSSIIWTYITDRTSVFSTTVCILRSSVMHRLPFKLPNVSSEVWQHTHSDDVSIGRQHAHWHQSEPADVASVHTRTAALQRASSSSGVYSGS